MCRDSEFCVVGGMGSATCNDMQRPGGVLSLCPQVHAADEPKAKRSTPIIVLSRTNCMRQPILAAVASLAILSPRECVCISCVHEAHGDQFWRLNIRCVTTTAEQ